MYKAIFLILLFLFVFSVSNFHMVSSHIPENAPNVVVKKIDKYKVLFLPYPKEPIKGDNTTLLNLNIVDENGDLKNIYSSVIISNKKNSSIVFQTPFKFYTTGDISLPFSFPDNGDFIVSLLTSINGDTNYEKIPVIANFDLKVRSDNNNNFFDSILNMFKKLA